MHKFGKIMIIGNFMLFDGFPKHPQKWFEALFTLQKVKVDI